MRLLDVNVLLYAFAEQADPSGYYAEWLEHALAERADPIGVPDIVLSSFLRIATHPGGSRKPVDKEPALQFAQTVRSASIRTNPGPQHWGLFVDLMRLSEVQGKRVADAYLAAIALEHGASFVTTDDDFDLFPGLKRLQPFG